MIVAAHQPHSFPWLGFLHKMTLCDVFVLMDDLQFEGQNFQNRNRVKVNNGTTWITVPLQHGPQDQRICDKQIVNRPGSKEHWQRRIGITLETHYGRAPHYNTYASEIDRTFKRTFTRLLDFNLHMIELCRQWLGITTRVVLASSLELRGQKTSRILHMCERLGADTYLSGRGGSSEYLDRDAFAQAGVTLGWQSYVHPTYPQRYHALGFIKQLAALDLLFNCGPQSSAIAFAGENEERHGKTI